MTRDEAIQIISGLYPTDSEFECTNEVGEELLNQARRELNIITDWKDEPTEVLVRYAELCEQREREEERKIRQRQQQRF